MQNDRAKVKKVKYFCILSCHFDFLCLIFNREPPSILISSIPRRAGGGEMKLKIGILAVNYLWYSGTEKGGKQ